MPPLVKIVVFYFIYQNGRRSPPAIFNVSLSYYAASLTAKMHRSVLSYKFTTSACIIIAYTINIQYYMYSFNNRECNTILACQ